MVGNEDVSKTLVLPINEKAREFHLWKLCLTWATKGERLARQGDSIVHVKLISKYQSLVGLSLKRMSDSLS